MIGAQFQNPDAQTSFVKIKTPFRQKAKGRSSSTVIIPNKHNIRK
jgi:hypothetical protein